MKRFLLALLALVPARMHSNRTLTTTAGPLGELQSTERFEYELASLAPASLTGD